MAVHHVCTHRVTRPCWYREIGRLADEDRKRGNHCVATVADRREYVAVPSSTKRPRDGVDDDCSPEDDRIGARNLGDDGPDIDLLDGNDQSEQHEGSSTDRQSTAGQRRREPAASDSAVRPP